MRIRHRVLACALVSALTLIVASSFAAPTGVPSPLNSKIPKLIWIVGRSSAGLADTAGRFRVVYRDVANNPIPNALIRVEFLAAAGVRLCSAQEAPVSAMDCGAPNPWVEGLTGPDGSWSPSVSGCSNGTVGLSPDGLARFHAPIGLLGSARVAILDLTGCNGMGANDLSSWLIDFGAANGAQRSDYDGNGTVGANDLSLWLNAFGSMQSAEGCGLAVCP